MLSARWKNCKFEMETNAPTKVSNDLHLLQVRTSQGTISTHLQFHIFVISQEVQIEIINSLIGLPTGNTFFSIITMPIIIILF